MTGLAPYNQSMLRLGFRRLGASAALPLTTLMVALALAGGCSNTASVTFHTGPVSLQMSAADFALPTVLRDDSTMPATVASIACGPMGMCPSSPPPDGVAITCESGVCNPAPHTITGPVGDVVDFDSLSSDLRTLFTQVDRIDVDDVSYAVTLNTLSVDMPEIDIFWGPEGAVDVDPAMDVMRLGLMPPTAARSTGTGTMQVDPAGEQALSNYLVNVSRRVRFFAQTKINLEPGQPFPEGSFQASVDMTVTAQGQIVK